MKGWLLGAKILWLTAPGNREGVLMIVAAYILLFYILVHYLLSQGFSAELMIVSFSTKVFPAITASPLQKNP